MLLATLVLVSVNCEHDGLEEGIDFGHRDQSTEVRNVTRFSLEKEEQVAVLLCLVIVGEEPLLGVNGIVQAVRDFVLLYNL